MEVENSRLLVPHNCGRACYGLFVVTGEEGNWWLRQVAIPGLNQLKVYTNLAFCVQEKALFVPWPLDAPMSCWVFVNKIYWIELYILIFRISTCLSHTTVYSYFAQNHISGEGGGGTSVAVGITVKFVVLKRLPFNNYY